MRSLQSIVINSVVNVRFNTTREPVTDYRLSLPWYARVCVSKCSHCRHLEISPSPFKWEVSCRALGTVRVGNPDKQTESHREWVSEWVCALPVSKNIYASQQCSACLSLLTVILPQTAAGSLHSEGPGGQVRAEKRLSQTTVLCMRWAIKAGEEEEEDGSLSPPLLSVSLVESAGRTGTGEWKLDGHSSWKY